MAKKEQQEKIELEPTEGETRDHSMQTLYEQVVMDTKDIKSFLAFFKQATRRAQQLQDEYYQDVDEEVAADGELNEEILGMLDDDPVFDVTTDQQVLVQKLLLAIAKYLNYGIS